MNLKKILALAATALISINAFAEIEQSNKDAQKGR